MKSTMTINASFQIGINYNDSELLYLLVEQAAAEHPDYFVSKRTLHASISYMHKCTLSVNSKHTKLLLYFMFLI